LDNLTINVDKIRIVEKPRANKIDIMLGLKLPGLKPIFSRLVKYIRDNIIKKYWNNENSLRNYFEVGEINNEIDKYINEIDRSINYSINYLNNEPLLLKIVKCINDDKDELFNLLIEDYYTLFLLNNLKNKKNKIRSEEDVNNEINNLIFKDFSQSKELLKYMVELRNKNILPFTKQIDKEKGRNILVKLVKVINWTESYRDEITSIIKIFIKLNNKVPNLFIKIKNIIEEKQIEYEISSRNPRNTLIVNKVFFLSLDSILRVITSNADIYKIPSKTPETSNDSDNEFFKLINLNKDILQRALQLEADLNLRSKEAFSLQQIMKLIDAFVLKKN